MLNDFGFGSAALWRIGSGLLVAIVVTPLLIRRQRRGSLGQYIYEDAPKSHASKAGTPTLGGVVFLLAAIVGALMGGAKAAELPLAGLVIAAGLVGFLDDMLIVRVRRALGLRAREKLALIAVIAVIFVVWVRSTGVAGTEENWFGGPIALPMWLWFTLAVLAIVGASNAVNLTDGLDGLAAGTIVPTLIALQTATLWQGGLNRSGVVDCVIGACFGFLWFNRHPARIFMGDTGSLALGVLIAGAAILSGSLLLLPLFGIVFVIEALSVIAQVASFKITGKRIFKMSPLHHHFELSGWRESPITLGFVLLQTVTAGAAWWGAFASNLMNAQLF